MQKFRSWLKYFFGSFIFNSLAKEGSTRSFGNSVLGFFLMLLFAFGGMTLSHNASFGSFYNSAPEFKEFAYAFFNGDGKDIKVDENKASCDLLINTYANQSDEKYIVNGYQLVVDFRDISKLYDDFTPYYVNGNGQRISYEQYQSLPNKTDYSFRIEYSGKLLNIGANQQQYKDYLAVVSDPQSAFYNKEIAELYGNIKTSDSLYQEKIYELYIKAYYPDMSGLESYSVAPTVKGYYSSLLNGDKNKKYLFVYSDTCMASFYGKDANFAFVGYYTELNGFVGDGTQRSADEFLTKAFDGGTSLTAFVYLLNFIHSLTFILLEWIVLSALVFIVARLTHQDYGKHLFAGFTIVGSSFFFTGVITFILSFAFNFMLEISVAYTAILTTLYVLPALRIAYLLIAEGIKTAKTKKAENRKNNQEIGA